MSANLGLAETARALQVSSSPPPTFTHKKCLWADPLDGFTFAYSQPAALQEVHAHVQVSRGDWARECRETCEKSALNAFYKLHEYVNGPDAITTDDIQKFRASASEPYCQGIVIVEPPWWSAPACLPNPLPGVPAEAPKAPNKETKFPWCYVYGAKHQSIDDSNHASDADPSEDKYLGNGEFVSHDELALKLENASAGMPASCRAKVTTISLLGCREDRWNVTKYRKAVNASSQRSIAEGDEFSEELLAAWILLPLCVLLATVFGLLYRHYSRRSANLRLSRDRAQLDLQMLSHQVVKIVSGGDDDAACSLPDSLLTDQRSKAQSMRVAPLSTAGRSLPPGPPSSSNAQSVVEQDESSEAEGARGTEGKKRMYVLDRVPLSWAEADRQFYASAAGKAYLAKMNEAASQGKQAVPLGRTRDGQPAAATTAAATALDAAAAAAATADSETSAGTSAGSSSSFTTSAGSSSFSTSGSSSSAPATAPTPSAALGKRTLQAAAAAEALADLSARET